MKSSTIKMCVLYRVTLPEKLKKIIPGEHAEVFGKKELLTLATRCSTTTQM